MKKRILSLFLVILLVAGLFPFGVVAAVTALNEVAFTVNASVAAGLDGNVKVNFSRSSGNYSGKLYLPGGVDTEKLTFSWDDGATVTVDGVACENGKAPVPENGKSLTYTVTSDGTTTDYVITTVQGSADVAGLFFTIDESLGTIAAMNGDKAHETSCYGAVSFEGKTYDMSIKGRGNSSWTYNFDKKPYNFTLYKDEDSDKEIKRFDKKKDAKLISGVESKKWSLLANAKDSSLLRNNVGYYIAQQLGIGVDFRYVDVWVNGAYAGNYLLTPKTDTYAPKKGYQLELERREDAGDEQFRLKGFENTERPVYFTVKDNGAEAETAEIRDWMQQVVDAIFAYDSTDYLAYIDLDSFAKMYLLNELYKDVDVVTDSIFMYRNGTGEGDKLFAGPIWDLDGSQGRTYANGKCGVPDNDQLSPDGWYIDAIVSERNVTHNVSLLQELGKHPEFMQRVYELYNEYQSAFESLPAYLDGQKQLIRASAEMNFMTHALNQTVERMFNVESVKQVGSGKYAIRYDVTGTWNDYVSNYKAFLTARLAFLSDQLSVTAPASGTITGTTEAIVGHTMTLTADTDAAAYSWQSSADGITWTDLAEATAKTYGFVALPSMDGLMVRCVAKNTAGLIDTRRVAKESPAAVRVLSPVTLSVTMEGHEHRYTQTVIKPTCTQQGYTTYECLCGDTYTRDYVDPFGHDYQDGMCSRCQQKDPDYVPQCVSKQTVSLSNGTYYWSLGDTELGIYTFAASGNGWTIRDSQERYIGFADNAFAYTGTPFVWTYVNGRFYTTVTTTSGGSIWDIIFGGGGRTVTTTYYLAYTGGRLTVSTNDSGSNAAFAVLLEKSRHTYSHVVTDGKTHTYTCEVCQKTETVACTYGDDHICTVCGAYDPDAVVVHLCISFTAESFEANPCYGAYFADRPDRGTSHTATMTVSATGATVEQVIYSTDHGLTWRNGTTVTGEEPLSEIRIRVTDSYGKVHSFLWQAP